MVGEILKKRREELGRDLREISNNLKIRYDYLKALEDGDLQKLPAEVYIKGYIQEYAKVLNLEPDSLVNAYVEESRSSLPEHDQFSTPSPLRTNRFKLRYVLIPACLVVLILVGLFRLIPSQNKPLPSSPPPETVTREVARTVDAGSPDIELQALATDTTWLLVTIDDASPKEILMQPGESLTWHAKSSFFLKIGNAGGIRLIFNGKELQKLGERGQVVKISLPDARMSHADAAKPS